MILLINNGDMACRENPIHEKHVSEPTQDRIIQTKLLSVDDKFDKEALIQFIEDASKPKTTKSIREKSEELTGWSHNSKVPLRKQEKDPPVPNNRVRDGGREMLSWRESRSKLVPNPRENYVFKHYQDIRYYMKQYREENSALDNALPQPKRVSAFYNPGFYNVAPQPVTRDYTTAQLWAKLHQNSQPGTFQYTRRDSYKLEKPSNGQKHLADPRVDSESSSESENRSGSSSRKKSASGSRGTTSKSPTKVCVPNSSNFTPCVTGSAAATSSPSTGTLKTESGTNGTRTLDTLNCVAAQEGQTDQSAWSGDASGCVAGTPGGDETPLSISRLSTTCLGATANVRHPPKLDASPKPDSQASKTDPQNSKQDQSSKLEASCTYHIFPAGEESPTMISSGMMWNPQKSAFERRSVGPGERDAGMNSPFKMKKPKSPYSKTKKEKNGHKGKLGSKEGFPPLPPTKTMRGGVVREKTLAMSEARRELSEAEKDPMLKVQSLRGRCHSTISFDDLQRSKVTRRRGSPSSNQCQSNPDTRVGSAEDEKAQRPQGHAEVKFEETTEDDGSMSYFRYWNQGGNRRHLALGDKGRKWCVDSEQDFKNFAELVLMNPDARLSELDPSIQKKIQGPSIASGMWFDAHGRAYVSLATRYDPTHHISPRTLDGLTWREKMEVLRQINKPQERIRRRPPRLTYFKADVEFEMIGCREPRDHASCDFRSSDPLSHDQVSNQRRMRHLIEQTKLKFANRPPQMEHASSKSKYWATDPDTGLDVHFNVSRPKFAFSNREQGSNKPRNVTEHESVQYRLCALESTSERPPLIPWSPGHHHSERVSRSQTCFFSGT